MIVTVTHLLTGLPVSKEIDITQEQFENYKQGNIVIQKVFPYLSDSDREFIRTGISDDEWDKLMKDPEEDEDEEEEKDEGGNSDDAEALASAGRGTDEDYRADSSIDDIPF